jgi:hypothetical protein
MKGRTNMKIKTGVKAGSGKATPILMRNAASKLRRDQGRALKVPTEQWQYEFFFGLNR